VEQLLTPADAAKMLSVSRQTLANWRVNQPNRVPFVYVAGLVRYRLADIEALIQQARSVA
jgi:hypothetical protein